MNLSLQNILNVHSIRGRDSYHSYKEVKFGELYLNMSIGTRLRQEDAIYFSEIEGNGVVYLAVADGLGSYEGGAEAARICIDALHESINTQGVFFSKEKLAKFIRLEMRHNQSIMSTPNEPGGACMTIAKVDVNDQKVTFYSMGDVQGMIVGSDGDSKFETNMDVTPFSKGITRALTPRLPGINFRVSGPIAIEAGDRVLCSSDGFSKQLLLSKSSKELPVAVNNYTNEVTRSHDLIKKMNREIDNSSVVSFELK